MAGTVDATATDFRLYVTPVEAAALVGQLHTATTKEAVAAALARIKKLVDPKKPNVGCGPQVARFLKAGDEV